jgi:uncharacterized RDD family membrane protein YckC
MARVGLVSLVGACAYESLSLIAIWLFSTAVFVLLFGVAETGWARFFLQVLLWLVAGAYFVCCWATTGQTLAAQAWKISVVSQSGQPLTMTQAILRYLLATLSLFGFGLGFLWAVFDREKLFLHDRILKTRFIKLNPSGHTNVVQSSK